MGIPRSFTSLLHFICSCSVENVILPLSIFDLKNIWNLPGFATTLLTLNQFETICVSLDSLWVYGSAISKIANFCFLNEKYQIIYKDVK